MKIRLIPAVLLFLGSYFPLALILVIQDVKPEYWELHFCSPSVGLSGCQLPQLANPELGWTFLALTLFSLLFFLFVMSRLTGSSEMFVAESKKIPNDLINYVFPYIVSFMGVEFSATGKVLGFTVFMLWMFLLSYRSGQILMNPLLLVAGWHLYEIRAEIAGHERNVRALSKENIVQGQTLVSCLVQGIYVLSKK